MAPICCLTIPYQTQKLCVRRVDESLAVRNLAFSRQRCCRFKPPVMLGCVSGVTVLDVSKDRSAFMFLDYLTPKMKAPPSLKLWNLLMMGTPDV